MSELTFAIRPAVLADAAAIARVHVETWRAAYAGLLPDAYLLQMSEARQRQFWHRVLSRRSSGSESALVAEAPGRPGKPAEGGAEPQVVGFGSAGRRRAVALPFEGEIYTLYVGNDWQGRGLGRGLLGGLFERLRGGGAKSAGLWVLTGNPSRFFYEAMGGRACAERQEPFAGELLDETAYVWDDLTGWLSAGR